MTQTQEDTAGQKGHRYECGCIHGYYWCDRHDIYTRTREDDRPPWGGPRPGPGHKHPPETGRAP